MYTQGYEIASLLARYALVALGAGFLLIIARRVVTEALALFRGRKVNQEQRIVAELRPLPWRKGETQTGLAVRSGAVPLPRDGIIGASRRCDAVLEDSSARAEHVQATLERGLGGYVMRFIPVGWAEVRVDGEAAPRGEGLAARDGSKVSIGERDYTLTFTGGREAEPEAETMSGRAVLRALALLTAFSALALGLLSVSGGKLDTQGVLLAALFPIGACASVMIGRAVFPTSDAPLTLAVQFLCAVGMIVQYRVRPESAMRQAAYYAAGTAAMWGTAFAVARLGAKGARAIRYPLIVSALALMILPLFIGSWINGAKNWIDLGALSLQPSELGKVALTVILAACLARRGRRLSTAPALMFVAGALGILFMQRDLGTALIYMASAMCVYYLATGDGALTAAGVLVTGAAGLAGYAMFPYVRRRIAAYRNPWADVLDKGYQTVQALMAIGSGGFFGLGLGNGMPKYIAAYSTDFVFAVICEEMGMVMGMIVLAAYIAYMARGASVALKAQTRYCHILAMSATVIMSVQTLIIVGGVIKLIPLTGVTLPFVSYGGSSMMACMMLTGVIHGAAQLTAQEERPTALLRRRVKKKNKK